MKAVITLSLLIVASIYGFTFYHVGYQVGKVSHEVTERTYRQTKESNWFTDSASHIYTYASMLQNPDGESLEYLSGMVETYNRESMEYIEKYGCWDINAPKQLTMKYLLGKGK